MSISSDDMPDDYFHFLLGKYKTRPPGRVWDAIEKSLDEDKLLMGQKSSLKRVAMFFTFLICAGFFPLMMGPMLKSKISYFQKTSAMPVNTVSATVRNHIISRSNQSNPVFLPTVEGSQEDKFSPISIPVETAVVLAKANLPNPIGPHLLMSDSIIKTGNNKFSLSEKHQPNHSSKAKDAQNILSSLFITPFFSKDFAGYNFSDHDIKGANGQEMESRERNILSASAGFYLGVRFNRHWIIQSGLSYSWSNNQIDSANSYAVKNEAGHIQFKFNTASGYSYLHTPGSIHPTVGDSISTALAYTQLRYITVPVVLSYRVPLGKFSFDAGAGVSFNFLTRASLQTAVYGSGYFENESEIPIQGLKKISIGLLVKSEIDYHLSRKWSIALIPSLRNTLSPVNLNSSVPVYPFSFSIGAGINFSF